MPLVLVSYRRDYFENQTGDRFTLDSNIRFSRVNLDYMRQNTHIVREAIAEVKSSIEVDNDVLIGKLGVSRTHTLNIARQ